MEGVMAGIASQVCTASPALCVSRLPRPLQAVRAPTLGLRWCEACA